MCYFCSHFSLSISIVLILWCAQCAHTFIAIQKWEKKSASQFFDWNKLIGQTVSKQIHSVFGWNFRLHLKYVYCIFVTFVNQWKCGYFHLLLKAWTLFGVSSTLHSIHFQSVKWMEWASISLKAINRRENDIVRNESAYWWFIGRWAVQLAYSLIWLCGNWFGSRRLEKMIVFFQLVRWKVQTTPEIPENGLMNLIRNYEYGFQIIEKSPK